MQSGSGRRAVDMCVHVFEMHKKTGGLNRLHDAKASLLKCYSSHVLGGHPVFLVKRRTTPPAIVSQVPRSPMTASRRCNRRPPTAEANRRARKKRSHPSNEVRPLTEAARQHPAGNPSSVQTAFGLHQATYRSASGRQWLTTFHSRASYPKSCTNGKDAGIELR